MVKPGNWGTWAVIERPRKRRKTKEITCEMCTCLSKDKSCKYNNNIDLQSSWRTCKKFYFKPQYDAADYWNKLVRERGQL